MWNMTLPRQTPSPVKPPTLAHAKLGSGEARVGVLDRSIAILDAVEGGARTFTQLVERTSLSRSTAHRLVGSLKEHGFLAQVESLGYVLGPRLLRLASLALREISLRDLAHPILEGLAASTGESAQLYLRSSDERICIDTAESSSELRTIVEPGARLPITAGSAGKVFMAWAPDKERERWLGMLHPFTDRTPVTPARMAEQLAAARRRGWAQSVEERQKGVVSVSAPIFGASGEVLAVVSVSGPRNRMGPQPGELFSDSVVRASREIEQTLGTDRSS